MQGYAETTRGITVTVRPVFLESRSSPVEHQYFWAYFIRIENHGAEPVQLMRRHWRITDSMGRVHEVRGDLRRPCLRHRRSRLLARQPASAGASQLSLG
jgi:hypothetical protein